MTRSSKATFETTFKKAGEQRLLQEVHCSTQITTMILLSKKSVEIDINTETSSKISFEQIFEITFNSIFCKSIMKI